MAIPEKTGAQWARTQTNPVPRHYGKGLERPLPPCALGRGFRRLWEVAPEHKLKGLERVTTTFQEHYGRNP